MLDFGYYNMDCNEGMKQFPDKFFDLAIVDPEYGINSGNRSASGKNIPCMNGLDTRFIKKDWDKNIPTKNYFDELFRVSKNQIIFGGNYFTNFLPVSRGWIFWDKKPILPNYSDGELAWTSFDKVLKRIVILWNGKLRTGIEKNYIAIHPTQKPVKLYRWILKNYAKPGDILLDTHVGSASSLIAFEMEGFNKYVAFETDKDYYRDSCARLEKERLKMRQETIFTPVQMRQPEQTNLL